jgi:hypothetical protein
MSSRDLPLVSRMKRKAKTPMERQKMPNMRKVRQPMWETALGVTSVITKLKSCGRGLSLVFFF